MIRDVPYPWPAAGLPTTKAGIMQKTRNPTCQTEEANCARVPSHSKPRHNTTALNSAHRVTAAQLTETSHSRSRLALQFEGAVAYL